MCAASGSGARRAFVTVPDGPRLEYVEQGEPSGTPVLMLHGYSDSWRSFAPVFPYLPPSIRAIAISQRGHGDSARPAAGYGMGAFAADAAAVLDVLGVPRAFVVGHSMGARIAEWLAAGHPGRVLGLALAGAFAPGEPSAGVCELDTAVAGVSDPVEPEFVRAFQAATAAGPLPEGLLGTAVAESLKVPAVVWQMALQGFVEGGRHAPPPARVPTLLVWGDRDAFTPRAEQEALLASRPATRLLVYEGVGHAVHWEQPERFARDLVAFVASVVR